MQAALATDRGPQDPEVQENIPMPAMLSRHGARDEDSPTVSASGFGKLHFMVVEQGKRLTGLEEQARQVNTAVSQATHH